MLLSFEHNERIKTSALFFDNGPLRWAAENSSKPGRQGHSWVLHAAPDWSRAHIDEPADQVAQELAKRFCDVSALKPAKINYLAAHRWLYSLVTNPLGVGSLWDPSLRLGVCGDWCQSARIEGAYLSGQAVAGRILGSLTKAEANTCTPQSTPAANSG